MARYCKWILFALIFFVSPAEAARVYLNGVPIDGVTGKTFNNVTVKIDSLGNINIIGEAYRVEKPSTGSALGKDPKVKAGKAVTQSYWLVTEKSPGKTQYDVDVYINGKWIRKIFDIEKQTYIDVSKYLVTGPNKIMFVAKKVVGDDGRVSTQPRHYFRIVIGEGKATGRRVVVTKALVDYRRTAAETRNFKDERILNAR